MARKQGTGSVYLPKGKHTYQLQYYRNGVLIRESAQTTEETEAYAQLAIRQGEIAKGVPLSSTVGKITWREATAALEADYLANDRDSWDWVERRLRLHLTPYFGTARKMATIETRHIKAYVAQRLTDPVTVTRKRRDGTTYEIRPRKARTTARASINRELAIIKRMLNLAKENGALLYAPSFSGLEEKNARSGFFEEHEFRAVCKHLTPEVAAVARFAYATGWRVPSEILTLQWSAIDFDAVVFPTQRVPGTITLDKFIAKNDEGRVFPFTAALQEVLLGQQTIRKQCEKAGHISPAVFVRVQADGQPNPIKDFRHDWNRACVKAGHPGKLPHDFRRTAARNLVRLGIPEKVAMRLTGHKTREVFERYNIVADQDLAAAAAMMDGAPRAVLTGTRGKVLKTFNGRK